MKTLYLLRHGEVQTKGPGSFLGRQNVPLTDRGREQMFNSARFLLGKSVQRLFCSPLTRCHEGAEITARILGLPVEVEQDLIEIDLGSWEGLCRKDVQKKFPADFAARGRDMAGFHPPGGESFNDLYNRVLPFFRRIGRLQEETVAVIAHAGVNRIILCHILDLPLNNLFRLGQDYGCINIINYSANPMRCGLLNWTTELGLIPSE